MLVGRSLYGRLDATPAFPGFVPLTTLKLVLVLSHDKNTNQVRHFSFIVIGRSQAFQGYTQD